MSEVCAGKGKCHGCLKWCDNCGDVGHICDARVEGRRCDCHPMPPEWSKLTRRRRDAEHRLFLAKQQVRDIGSELDEISELEAARNAHTEQVAEDERRLFGGAAVTTCLLCTSEAVADGLCVEDGARLWVSVLWTDSPAEAVAYQRLAPVVDNFPKHSREAPDRCKAILESVRNPQEAVAFLARLDAARASKGSP